MLSTASSSALVVGFSMPVLSQIVRTDASPQNHILCGEDGFGFGDNPLMDSTGKNAGPNYLRAWRAFREMTQEQLAELVGTNANMIGYLESGERGLSAKWLRRLAPALRTTPGMLLDHDPADLDSDIMEIWANGDARQKRQLAEIAKALIKTGTEG